jgi:hypothetical protein
MAPSELPSRPTEASPPGVERVLAGEQATNTIIHSERDIGRTLSCYPFAAL